VGQERLGPSYFFIPLVLGPLNRLVWWEVPLGYVALGSFLFLQEQIKDIIIILRDSYDGGGPDRHIQLGVPRRPLDADGRERDGTR
jgi:hypothetical protein